jgi:hypothetical protein
MADEETRVAELLQMPQFHHGDVHAASVLRSTGEVNQVVVVAILDPGSGDTMAVMPLSPATAVLHGIQLIRKGMDLQDSAQGT